MALGLMVLSFAACSASVDDQVAKQSDPKMKALFSWFHHDITSPDAEERRKAAWALAKRAEKGDYQALDELVSYLKHANPDVRVSAAGALSPVENKLKPYLPILIEALQDQNYSVRGKAATVLGNVDYDPVLCVPLLISALKDPEGYVRSGAARALGPFSTHHEIIVPALIQALKDSDSWVRAAAAGAFDWMPEDGAPAVPALIEALGDADGFTRTAAAAALGHVGLGSETAVAALRRSASRDTQFVREEAQKSLWLLGAEMVDAETIQLEILRLAKGNWDDRNLALTELSGMGRGARQAIPQLLMTLKTDKEWRWRSAAADILAQIGAEPEHVVPALIEALNDRELGPRLAAARALGKFAPAGRSALPDLLKFFLASRGQYQFDPGISKDAARSILKLEPRHPVVWAELLKDLQSPESAIRYETILFMAEQERLEPTVIPGVVQALQDPVPAIQRLAAYCLKKNGIEKEAGGAK